jgi:hypothetical protein
MISPDALEKVVSASTKDKLSSFLDKIDKTLQTEALSKGMDGLVVNISIQGIPRFVVDKAIRECRVSGWHAKIVYDQRDGDYLEVKRYIKSNTIPSYQQF